MTVSKKVLAQYEIGKVKSVKPVESGLVHNTFAIKTSTGDYIIQKLHPILSDQGTARDFLAVAEHLEKEEFLAPKCVLSKTGKVLAREGKEVWRMQTKLSGNTYDVIKDLSMLREAGKIYAQFHKTMDHMDYKFKSKLVLHETEKIYKKFLKILPLFKGELEGVSNEVEFIKKEFPKYFLPKSLPLRVIHGDPKVSNILFKKVPPLFKGGLGGVTAAAIIDLDTCSRSSILVELGDAFRSWCGNEEDDPKNRFCLRKFRSAWSGYKKGSDGFLTAREKSLIPKCIGTITLELACRFLTDYFEDSYFGWDSKRYKSRKEHNLARCRGQIKEFQDYKKKLSKIRRVVN